MPPPYITNTVGHDYNFEIQFLILLGGPNEVPTSPPKFLLRELFSDNAPVTTSKGIEQIYAERPSTSISAKMPPPYITNTVGHDYNFEIQFLILLGGPNEVPTSPPKFLLRGLFSDNAPVTTSKGIEQTYAERPSTSISAKIPPL